MRGLPGERGRGRPPGKMGPRWIEPEDDTPIPLSKKRGHAVKGSHHLSHSHPERFAELLKIVDAHKGTAVQLARELDGELPGYFADSPRALAHLIRRLKLK
jgi:hypothetical protein